jgi:HSP20 family protein
MALLNSLIPSLNRAPARRDQAVPTPSVRPHYEIKETDDAWGLTAHLPGATKADLSITDEDGALTIRAERSWKQPNGWTTLYRESSDLPYEVTLRHDGAIDADKARAELKDGVLRLSLPKAEARKPRKIAIG